MRIRNGCQEFFVVVAVLIYVKTLKVRCENGRENDIIWSEIGSGFGEPGGTLPPRISRSTPRGIKPLVSGDLLDRG